MSVPEPAAPAGISILAFATRLGVDEQVIRRAIRRGRIERAVAYAPNGRARITDPELAEREYRDNANRSKGPTGTGPAAGTIAEERRRLIQAQRRKVNLQIREKRGELVSRRAVEVRFATRVVTARAKLLGIPSRAKQRLPHLAPSDLAALDGLIREALEELADDRASTP